MAKKLDAATAKQLKKIGINAKNEEDARKSLLKELDKEGIEGMEDESLETLIEMVESFLEAEPDTEPEEDDEEEDEEEPETEPEPQPKAKKATKAKTETKKAEKKAVTAASKKTSKRGNKLDPRNNASDREVLNDIVALFGKGYEMSWLSSNGGTLKHVGKNSKRGVLTIENLTRQADGNVTCNIYFLTMAKQTDKFEELGIEYDVCWTKTPMLKLVSLDEAKEVVEKLLQYITEAVEKIDKRLGENRQKMEENLKKTAKSETKATKTAEPATEEKPAKKATKKAKK